MVVLFPVIFIHIQGKSVLLFHAHHGSQLEEMSLIMVGRRLSYADKTAAVVDKLLHRGDNLLVRPVLPAGVSSVRISHVEDHIDIIQDIRILADIVKA